MRICKFNEEKGKISYIKNDRLSQERNEENEKTKGEEGKKKKSTFFIN